MDDDLEELIERTIRMLRMLCWTAGVSAELRPEIEDLIAEWGAL